jgi:hypothetical protein
LPTTSHVAIGAAVLATSLTLAIRARKILGVPHRVGATAPARTSVSGVAGNRVTA